jgi:hypothetical protein
VRERDFPSIPHPDRLDPSRQDYQAILEAHENAMAVGEPGYRDPSSGLFVLTAAWLHERNTCCDQGCRHCPYVAREEPPGRAG